MTGEQKETNRQWAEAFRSFADKLDSGEIVGIEYTMHGDPRDICIDFPSITYYDGGQRSWSFTYEIVGRQDKSLHEVFNGQAD